MFEGTCIFRFRSVVRPGKEWKLRLCVIIGFKFHDDVSEHVVEHVVVNSKSRFPSFGIIHNFKFITQFNLGAI